MPKQFDNGSRPVDPEQFGELVHSFCDHIKEHPSERVRAALLLVANEADEEPKIVDGVERTPMHVCNFGGGDHDLLAEILATTVQQLGESNPEFRMAFQAHMLRNAVQTMITHAKQENVATTTAADLLAKVMKKDATP